MKYLLAFVSLMIGLGLAGPPLYYTHALPVAPAIGSFACIGFAFYLFDPTNFLEYSVEIRKGVKAWFTKGDA